MLGQRLNGHQPSQEEIDEMRAAFED